MIEGIGYTTDGQVWIQLVIEVKGEKMSGTLMLQTGFAKVVSQNLLDAAMKAEEVSNVRNRTNIN